MQYCTCTASCRSLQSNIRVYRPAFRSLKKAAHKKRALTVWPSALYLMLRKNWPMTFAVLLHKSCKTVTTCLHASFFPSLPRLCLEDTSSSVTGNRTKRIPPILVRTCVKEDAHCFWPGIRIRLPPTLASALVFWQFFRPLGITNSTNGFDFVHCWWPHTCK